MALSAISTIAGLSRNDFSLQRKRFTVASAAYVIAGLSALIAVIFASAAAVVWLAQTYGMLVALCMTSSGFLALSAVLVLGNALYQRRQKKKLARSAAVKGAALATMLSVGGEKKSLAPLLIIGAGLLLGGGLGSRKQS